MALLWGSNLEVNVLPLPGGGLLNQEIERHITDSLVKNVRKILDLEEVDAIVSNIQLKALIGSMRVLKSALSMKPC